MTDRYSYRQRAARLAIARDEDCFVRVLTYLLKSSTERFEADGDSESAVNLLLAAYHADAIERVAHSLCGYHSWYEESGSGSELLKALTVARRLVAERVAHAANKAEG